MKEMLQGSLKIVIKRVAFSLYPPSRFLSADPWQEDLCAHVLFRSGTHGKPGRKLGRAKGSGIKNVPTEARSLGFSLPASTRHGLGAAKRNFQAIPAPNVGRADF